MLERAVLRMARALNAIAGIGIVVMLVLVCSDVLSRLIFKLAIPGTDTIVASYLMVATIFLPLALLQVLEENISVEVLTNLVPVRLQSAFDLIGHVLTAVFYGLLAYLYFHVATEAYVIREFVSGTWDVPIWPARIIMPLGLAAGVIAASAMALAAMGRIRSGQPDDHHSQNEGPMG